MAKFWELFEESVVIQGIVTLIAVGVVSYAVIVGVDVPKEYWFLVGAISGFWFGQKGNVTTNRVIEKTLARVVHPEG